MRDLIVPALAAAFATASSADAQTAEDAHVIRPVRGDVFVVHGEVAHARSGTAPSAYVAPFPNWRYSAVRRGDRLQPAFYAGRYVIAQPERYGLAVARGDHRWIRYGDDLLLVDRRTGRVLRLAPNRYSTISH